MREINPKPRSVNRANDNAGSTEPAHVHRDYLYADSSPNCSHTYLWPAVERILRTLYWPPGPRRLFEIGCGNGATAKTLSDLGYVVSGIDASATGIAQATALCPELRLEVGSAYDALAERFGTFPVVLSLEVVEHLYSPQQFARVANELLDPGGTLVHSTPYHGYFKNLALALSGAMERHFTVLWEGGHIKFFSFRTLTALLSEAGFEDIAFTRVGRVPPLAKSMIAIARKRARNP